MAEPPLGGEPHTTDTARSATRPPRKRARRGRAAKIEAKARARQEAWAEGGHPNLTHPLTVDLNGPEHVLRPEGLFAQEREARRGAIPPGEPSAPSPRTARPGGKLAG